jgi:hypothetical protein
VLPAQTTYDTHNTLYNNSFIDLLQYAHMYSNTHLCVCKIHNKLRVASKLSAQKVDFLVNDVEYTSSSVFPEPPRVPLPLALTEVNSDS